MKTRILLLVFALAAATLHAQRESDYLLWNSIADDFGDEGVYNIIPRHGIMQQRDGNFLIPTGYSIEYHHGHPSIYLGDVLYKVSPSPLILVDSLFMSVADTLWPPDYYFDRDPRGEGNIRASIEYDEEKDSTFLFISHFSDDSFYINHDEDIVSPLGGGRFYSRLNGYMIDCRGDLIIKYWTSGCDSVYMARFGLDGTLKHKALLPSLLNDVYNMGVLKESPLQYWQWRGYSNANLAIIVMDSAFQIKNTAIINKMLNEEFIAIDTLVGHTIDVREYLYFNTDTRIIPIGGDDVLLAARYTHDTVLGQNPEHGVAVARYDLRTMERKALIVFNDYSGWVNEARCYGFHQMSDGTLYFLYQENGYPPQGVVVVKMDTDLNVEWKHWYKTNHIAMLPPFSFSILYEDEHGEEKGIAWLGSGLREGEEPGPGQNGKLDLVLFLLNHDGTVGINEGGMEVRPYALYPNPVQSQLRMQFSPDVQPAQVQLYDLQGRLVRNQYQAFEHINMGSLSAGTYLMRITLTDGQVFSEKVVKE